MKPQWLFGGRSNQDFQLDEVVFISNFHMNREEFARLPAEVQREGMDLWLAFGKWQASAWEMAK